MWKVRFYFVAVFVNETLTSPLSQDTKAVAGGDLTKKIDVDARGGLKELKETVNSTTESLSVFANEVTRIAREVATEGRLGGQARVTNVGGTWKDLTGNVNVMANDLTLQVRTIAVATTAVARGDPTQKIGGVSISGEMLSLVNTVNDMIDQLAIFAAEVKKVAREVRMQGKLGVQAEVGNVQGIWQEIALSAAAMDGDFTRFITVEASGEMASLKTQINRLAFNLRNSIQKNTAAREAVELASRSKSEFLAFMSHEIMTRMDGIIARSLLLIIDDILDISNIKAGRMTMEAVTYSLHQAAFGVLETLVVYACRTVSILPTTSISISLTSSSFTPSRFNRKGHVCSSRKLLALDNQSVTLEFCVTDTGIGIIKDKSNLIADTFYQADGQRPEYEYGGTGLGLSISKRPVSLMQATLANMGPFARCTILFANTVFDKTGVVDRIRKLNLRPYVVHDATEVGNKETYPYIDPIVVNTLHVVEYLREFKRGSGVEGNCEWYGGESVSSECRLGGQARVPHVGRTWKDLTDNVNVVAPMFNLTVRTISVATTAIARGNPSQTIGGEHH
ncbi:hypothetical protein NMY22_g14421 [Coprinellus aureogranulatus]|nr:hypothetical protein NMY22_g14421 [Coprinellus aureogranulatus]